MIRRIPSSRRTLELLETQELSPSVRRFVFRSVDGRAIDYLAGQWMKLYLPGGLERDYSIASAPVPEGHVGADRIELAITRVERGAGSAALFALTPGARVESLGPNGLFVREDRHRDVAALYVATGTGLAPLRAMLLDELARPETTPQVLLFGCRTEADLLYRGELEPLARTHARVRYVPTLSRPSESWAGRRGYVQAHLRELLAELGSAHVYVCGLSKMIDEVRRTLKEELGVDRRFVHTERYD
ncbi:MAG: FAD-dependent oxidoreductase [Sandaracinaceae bacterium]|nr:FAD-dependent oxidoreductase [Sandaracinaceae bacterium]